MPRIQLLRIVMSANLSKVIPARSQKFGGGTMQVSTQFTARKFAVSQRPFFAKNRRIRARKQLETPPVQFVTVRERAPDGDD
jgi:hypothetical protein